MNVLWRGLLLLLPLLSSCFALRAYKVRKLRLTDHQKVPSVAVEKSTKPFYFLQSADTAAQRRLSAYLDTSLAHSHTVAFLVLRNDSLLYERYWNGFSAGSLLPSFSVVKSFVGTLVALAVDEGAIPSTHLPITHYLPELARRDKAFEKITIQHLMDMRSGIRFREGRYNLKDEAIRLSFRPNLQKHALRLSIEEAPGQRFNYKSINTQLLALILERATGKSVSAYLQQKLWEPLGMEYRATWNVDSRKHRREIGFAGLNATARDFAKLGRLYLQKGNWNGRQLLSERWTSLLANPDSMHRYEGYRNQWWARFNFRYFTDSLQAVAFRSQTPYSGHLRKLQNQYRVGYRTGAFSAQGILNQSIYVNPRNGVIIVRLGRFWQHPALSADQFIYELGDRL